jgi:deazaflavin-dependent oxidoreductase (nitroreductase family)
MAAMRDSLPLLRAPDKFESTALDFALIQVFTDLSREQCSPFRNRGDPMNEIRYIKPRKGENLLHGTVQWLTRRGVSLLGSRVLYVRGRKSGELRSNPVNLLTYEGEQYLVAPRGSTQWVRNLRVAGEGELRVGRRVERFEPIELGDDEKPALLREYLKRWKWEVGMFFDGVDASAPDEKLREIAPGYPVFRIVAVK